MTKSERRSCAVEEVEHMDIDDQVNGTGREDAKPEVKIEVLGLNDKQSAKLRGLLGDLLT